MWFRLLDAIAIPMRTYRTKTATSEGFWFIRNFVENSTGVGRVHSVLTLFMRNVLAAMNGYIPLPSILNKIVKDHGGDEFGDFKSVILGMLDSYTYEQMILQLANKLIINDTFSAQKQLIKLRSKAVRYQSSKQESLLPKDKFKEVCFMY